MQIQTVPTTALVGELDTHALRRDSLTGWLRHSNDRLLAPTLSFDPQESRPVVADLLETAVSRQVGASILGPREMEIADRLVIAEFVFRDTRRRIPTRAIAVWLSMPFQLDWVMNLYYASWYAYLSSHALARWLEWQPQGILPMTALRRTRERLLEDAVGVLTRLELVEFLKHLDALAAEW